MKIHSDDIKKTLSAVCKSENCQDFDLICKIFDYLEDSNNEPEGRDETVKKLVDRYMEDRN